MRASPWAVVSVAIWSVSVLPAAHGEDFALGARRLFARPVEMLPAPPSEDEAADSEYDVVDYTEPAVDQAGVWPAETNSPPQAFDQAWAAPAGGPNFADWTEHDRQFYFGTELLLAWGLAPGNNLIGSDQFANLFFFPQAPNIFPHQTTGAFGDQFHYGARGRFGWDEPDDSGVMLSGFYVFGMQHSRGPGRVYDGSDIHDLRTLASIPLNDGAGGQIVPFDSEFQQTYNQQVFGGDIDVYLAPFFARPSFRMKFLYGARYLQVREQFQVAAGDSGLGYFVNLADGSIDYSSVTNIGIPPYRMTIQSQTRSQMVGPQIGVRYDMGNEMFKLWGQTKFAVAADFERRQISGENVVNGFQAAAQQGPAFQQSASTTHAVPIFETSIYADFYFFAMLPLVRDIECLRCTQFRIGFDYLLIGEVARPANVIAYDTPVPSLKSNRTWFDLKMLTLGLNWRF